MELPSLLPSSGCPPVIPVGHVLSKTATVTWGDRPTLIFRRKMLHTRFKRARMLGKVSCLITLLFSLSGAAYDARAGDDQAEALAWAVGGGVRFPISRIEDLERIVRSGTFFGEPIPKEPAKRRHALDRFDYVLFADAQGPGEDIASRRQIQPTPKGAEWLFQFRFDRFIIPRVENNGLKGSWFLTEAEVVDRFDELTAKNGLWWRLDPQAKDKKRRLSVKAPVAPNAFTAGGELRVEVECREGRCTVWTPKGDLILTEEAFEGQKADLAVRYKLAELRNPKTGRQAWTVLACPLDAFLDDDGRAQLVIELATSTSQRLIAIDKGIPIKGEKIAFVMAAPDRKHKLIHTVSTGAQYRDLLMGKIPGNLMVWVANKGKVPWYRPRAPGMDYRDGDPIIFGPMEERRKPPQPGYVPLLSESLDPKVYKGGLGMAIKPEDVAGIELPPEMRKYPD